MTAPTFHPPRSELTEQHKAHGANWLKWLGHLTGQPAYGMEIGCWLGESSEWFMEHVLTHDKAKLYTVDHFEGSDEHRIGGVDCSGNERTARSRLARFEDRAVVIKGHSHHAIRNLQSTPFDFVYVDASHDAMNVLRDSVLAFDCLKVGGILIWDDYLWEVMEQTVDRPKLAIDSFIACYARHLEVLGTGWQVAARKTS